MGNEKDKYGRVIMFLKKTKPEMGDADIFSEKVLQKIQEKGDKPEVGYLIYEFLFGWVYIGWVRKSLIMASIVLIVFFGYQQTVIMKRINNLSEQTYSNGKTTMTNYTDQFTLKLRMYKMFGNKIGGDGITDSEKDIDNLIESLNELKVKYKDLFDKIENDPELKKYIEEKLREMETKKPKM